MVDIGTKPAVRRIAVAEGRLRLRLTTVQAIRAGRVAKGSVIAAAELAGMLAVKRTPDLIPLCHPIPLTRAAVRVVPEAGGVRATCEVEATYRTGVEMESLTGVTIALLTVWDMVKALEKDATGNYPEARINGVRVVSKVKGRARGGRR